MTPIDLLKSEKTDADSEEDNLVQSLLKRESEKLGVFMKSKKHKHKHEKRHKDHCKKNKKKGKSL